MKKNETEPIRVGKRLGALSWGESFRRYRLLYMMLIPSLIYYVVFHYVPIYGLTLAFKEFRFSRGILGSPWAEPMYRQFTLIFTNPSFIRAFRNTLILAFMRLLIAFPFPIAIALLLNEVRSRTFARTIQTALYLPHFISWVVIGSLLIMMLSARDGIVNDLLALLGLDRRSYMISRPHFRSIIVASHIWKTAGWGAIIYIAALAGVDPQLYDAAKIDGAGRLRLIWSVSLASILPTIVIMLLLSLGNILQVGFEQILVLYSPPVYEVGDVIDTYVYRIGVLEARYSYATAAGLFKSVVSLVMIVSANWLARRVAEMSIF